MGTVNGIVNIALSTPVSVSGIIMLPQITSLGGDASQVSSLAPFKA